MKTRFFTTAIALMALTFVFNSCEKEDDEPTFPVDIELLMEDEITVGTSICKNDFYKVDGNIGGRHIKIHIGTDKEKLISEMADTTYLTPNKQYFWQVEVRDMSKDKYYYSDIRTFYCLGSIEFTTDNGENEIAAVVRWTNDSKYKNYKVVMTPTKECGFTGKTFDIPEGQDSLYVKWLDNTSIPYMFNDFDDLHGINYEPVVYNFKLTADVTIGDKTFEASGSAKEIFLNKTNHVRDHEMNVYRVAEVGDQVWMADDLRCTSYINSNGDTIPLKLNKDYIVSELPSGAKGILYTHDFLFDKDNKFFMGHIKGMVPQSFHYAADEDWNKLEKVYGIDAIAPKYYDHFTSKDEWCLAQYEFPTLGCYDYDYYNAKADSLYANSSYIDLWEVFASVSDWVDENGNNVCPSISVFNIKPFGVGYGSKLYHQGYGALYYSNPTRTRTFFSMKQGIGHYAFRDYCTDSYRYAVRLVKDI